MTLGNSIKFAREKMGLSQEAAAKEIRNRYRVRLSSAYLSMIERGERVNLTTKLAHALREFFQIDREAPVQSYYRLPILGTIRTGIPLLNQESYAGYFDVPNYINADYVIQFIGDSMAGGGILDGDYIICRETDTAQNGQIVVVLRDLGNGFSEAVLKYYFYNSDNLQPQTEYRKISDVSNAYGERIAGVMKGLIRKDAPGRHIYRDYLNAGANEDWTEVIELASSAGLKTKQVKEILAGQIEIAKKLRGSNNPW